MFVVSDLDGTLALIDHRRHFLDGPKKDWDAFFRACPEDEPHWPIINAVKALDQQANTRIEVWSGRSDMVRAESQAWLDRVGLGHLPLRMRRHGDFTPDDTLKESWMLSEPTKPDLIFDDRDKVVSMWRRHAITCAQVAPGNF